MTSSLPTTDTHQFVLQQLMQPEHANPHGAVHGGVVMKLIDEAAGICAMRYARKPCVTVCVDSMQFHFPVHIGELLRCHARVTWTGRTSVEVWVRVEAEDLIRGVVTHTNSAYAVYVALDEEGIPAPVPPHAPRNEEERKLWQEALQRHHERLGSRRS